MTVTAKADSDTVAYGTEVNITATVSGEYGNVSYQWYMSKDGGATWKKTTLEGNKSDALIFTATNTLMKYYFRVSVKDENGTWYSDKVRVKNGNPTCSMSVSVAGMNDAEIEEAFVYDWTEKGYLVISWSSKNTTGVYTFDDSLVTMSVSNSGIQSFNYYGIPGLPEETTETSFTIPKETLKTARSISLTIIAKDKNYEFNGCEISKTLYVTLPRHVAVLIGNDYSGTSSPLSGTINDVTALKGMLEGLDQNWEVYAFKNQSVNNMKYYMKNIFNSTQDFDTCLFYYSGHGVDGGVGGSYPDGELSNEAPGDVNGDRCLSIGEVKDYAKSCIDEIRADYLATVEEYMDVIMAEWNDNAVIGIYAGNPVHVQDVYSSFEEYLQENYLEGAYDQVTSSFGADDFIMFRR